MRQMLLRDRSAFSLGLGVGRLVGEAAAGAHLASAIVCASRVRSGEQLPSYSIFGVGTDVVAAAARAMVVGAVRCVVVVGGGGGGGGSRRGRKRHRCGGRQLGLAGVSILGAFRYRRCCGDGRGLLVAAAAAALLLLPRAAPSGDVSLRLVGQRARQGATLVLVHPRAARRRSRALGCVIMGIVVYFVLAVLLVALVADDKIIHPLDHCRCHQPLIILRRLAPVLFFFVDDGCDSRQPTLRGSASRRHGRSTTATTSPAAGWFALRKGLGTHSLVFHAGARVRAAWLHSEGEEHRLLYMPQTFRKLGGV
mmetsp:Transcript_2777/g.10142  ORF Transcript_2777/g.10142 Transcript_2777/m.10142 type:complete len:309 (-) Transcript_2777:911-1837(-)